MSNRTIVSLAILKVNWDRFGKDYIENFVPLIAECIRICPDEVVSLPTLQGGMRDQFGLDLPQHLLETLLKRARKRKYITLAHGVYRPNRERLKKLGFREERDRVLRRHEEVIDRLVIFGNKKYSLGWSADDSEKALLSFLDENELLVINTTRRGSAIPEAEYPHASAKFIVGAFVRELQDTHSGALSYLDTIVKGNMLANALFLPDPYEPHRNFRDTEIYFDTTFLIYALGYAGETRQAPCIELLDLLYETGANLRCFDHTLQEVVGALDACGAQLSRGRGNYTYGPGIPTFQYFLSKRYTPSDIELLIGRLERDLRSLRISVLDKPEYLAKYTIDENDWFEYLNKRIKYWRKKAAERDVDSISAIYRLRACREYRFVEECKALFITNNKRLVRAVGEYFYRDANPSSISPCLTDFSLANLLWLKKPTAAPDLPIKRIIADCFAATQPDEDLWIDYLKEVDRLEQEGDISPDDYYYLRYSMEAKTALMDKTLGEREAFTQGTVAEILENVKESLRADIKEKLELSEGRVRSLKVEKEEIRRNIRIRSERVAKLVAQIMRYGLLLFLVFVTVITVPWFQLETSIPIQQTFLWIIWAPFSVLLVLNLLKGTTVEAIIRRFEVSLSKWIEKRLITLLT